MAGAGIVVLKSGFIIYIIGAADHARSIGPKLNEAELFFPKMFGEKNMKARILTFLVTLFLITQITYSQSGWFWQNPLPQGNNLYNIEMINANIGFACNWDNILRTINGGESWQLLYTGFASYNQSLCMVDQNTGYILLDSTKLIKTTSGGDDWFLVSEIENLKLQPWDTQCLYFITASTGLILTREGWSGTRLMRTANGGLNWSTLIADTSFELKGIDFPSTSTGFAVGSRNLPYNQFHFVFFRTTNGGNSWDSLSNTSSLGASCVDFIDVNTGFAGGGYFGTGGRYLLKTTNAGLNWTELNFNFGGFLTAICFIDQNTGFVLDYTRGIYKSTNGGANWQLIELYSVAGNNDLRDLSFYDFNTGWVVGAGGLILKTSDGGINWEKKSQGVDTWLWDVEFANSKTGFTGGEYGKLLKTTNGGINWNLIQFPQENEFSSIEKIDDHNWYVASSSCTSKVFKTSNLGLTWDTLKINVSGITRLDFINASTGFGVCKYQYFFKTTNGGINWIIYDNLNYGQNWALDFIDENTGFAGGIKTYKTTNGGINWDPGVGSSPADIQFINSTTGYIATIAGSVLKTTNTGLNWTEILVTNGYLTDINMINENTGFATSTNTAYKTTNGGLNWFQIRICSNNSLSVVYFPDTLTGFIVGGKGTIIKTTNGGGEPIGIQPITSEVPEKFLMYQNYPNPFNPLTKIKFEVSLDSRLRGNDNVTLKIYDILGREVAVLVNEQLNPGVYEVEWNGFNYASGVYFYQLSINNEQLATKKMVLLK